MRHETENTIMVEHIRRNPGHVSKATGTIHSPRPCTMTCVTCGFDADKDLARREARKAVR